MALCSVTAPTSVLQRPYPGLAGRRAGEDYPMLARDDALSGGAVFTVAAPMPHANGRPLGGAPSSAGRRHPRIDEHADDPWTLGFFTEMVPRTADRSAAAIARARTASSASLCSSSPRGSPSVTPGPIGKIILGVIEKPGPGPLACGCSASAGVLWRRHRRGRGCCCDHCMWAVLAPVIGAGAAFDIAGDEPTHDGNARLPCRSSRCETTAAGSTGHITTGWPRPTGIASTRLLAGLADLLWRQELVAVAERSRRHADGLCRQGLCA